MKLEYSIGYSTAKLLRPLTESESEKAAIARLEDFKGSERDLRVAAALFLRAGEGANAAELLRLLDPKVAVR